jgi:oligopeptide transport system substrate-binding protein
LLVAHYDREVQVAEAVRSMWQKTLGVEVAIQQQEYAVLQKTIKIDPPQIFWSRWVANYPDANAFLKEAFHSGSPWNYTGWTNPEFDRLVDEAGLEPDEAQRRELYAQAETILVQQDAAIAPVYWWARRVLTKPYVQRTFARVGGEHVEKWDMNGQ